MNDRDLYKAFKESSETDRDFNFKSSGWYKVNRLLNSDDQKKKRKWFLFLPWVLTGAILGFCIFLFQNQANSNKQIKALIAQMNGVKIIKTDTITTIKYIYIHDTIITKKIIYVSPPSASIIKNSTFNSSNILNTTSELQSDKNQIQESNNTIANKKLKNNLLDKNNQGDTFNNNKTLIGNNNSDSNAQMVIADNIIKTNPSDSIGIKEIKQENRVETKNDSLTDIKTSTDLEIAELPEKEKVKKPKYKLVAELGAYAGALFPTQKNVKYQLGYNAGFGYQVFLSPNFQLQLKAAYSQLHFETKQFNATIGIPYQASPNLNAGYVFENAISNISSLNTEIGFNFTLPLKYKIKPFVGIAYGGRYLLRSKAYYTYYNNINGDIIVEFEDKSRYLVLNNLIPSLGFYKLLNEKWTWYLTGFYNLNTSSKTIAAPNYLGVNTSFFFKF